jgi:hypothetical protein
MQRRSLSIPEIAIIAGTRGALGAGLGLLLAGYMSREQRRAVGWSLLGVGLLSTIPIAVQLLSHAGESIDELGEGRSGCAERLSRIARAAGR